jgi:adenine-specific DNA-methyltransferase
MGNKLELTWIGKEHQPKLEPRILIEDPAKSYGDQNSENMLIFGDNLLALKALEQDFTGKIKCIYIDPPYNTGNAFEHYDDNLEHSIWLNLMKPRLELLHRLLREDGSLWISIDDDECHYLKVLCDEIFGRRNFVANVIWEKKFSPQNDAKWLSDSHDHILVYAKNKEIWKPNLLPRTPEMDARYKNPDNDPRGPWTSSDLTAQEPFEYGLYEIVGPTGIKFSPGNNRHWIYSKEKMEELIKDNRIWFGPTGRNKPRLKKFLSEVQSGVVPKTIWKREEVGDNQEAKREVKVFNKVDVFQTPKPERLIQRILTLGSNENDWVLDSFLGSGTTAAVAHKMRRKWIGVELGEHCHTHCLPRLKAVVDGTDQGGISKAVNWKGGGGFKYYYLAPSLLNRDQYGNWVISKEYNPQMLAAAMAKHEGFRYAPDEKCYWKQGRSTEKDFIFTTTNFVTVEFIDAIHEEMLPDESLLICCRSFQEACTDRYPNITVKKIPNMLLGRCEFGKEDYSLNIVNIPLGQGEFPVEPDQEPEDPAMDDNDEMGEEEQLTLFDEEVENEPDCQ